MADRLLRFSDDELAVALGELGGRLDYPAIGNVSAAVVERLRARPAERVIRLPRGRLVRRAVFAAIAAVLLLGAAAVAGKLGVPGLRVIFEPGHAPSNLPVGRNLFLGDRVSLEQARRTISFRVVTPHGQDLGPATVYVGTDPPPGRVSLVYPSSAQLPASRFTRAGLLITEFEARLDRAYLQKLGFSGTNVRSVDVDGDHGLWFSGEPHELVFIDRDGIEFSETARLAGNTLLWAHEGLTIRLECHCSLQMALQIARSVR